MDDITVITLVNSGDSGVEVEIDLVLQLIVYITKNDIVNISAEVANLCIKQMQPVFKALALYLAVGSGIELCSLSTVTEIDGVDILHQLNGLDRKSVV